MNNLKFRAWHKPYKQMCQIPRIDFESKTIAIEYMHGGQRLFRVCRPEEVELMQWTGLTDKNGKQIFEGDIIRINSDMLSNWDSAMKITERWVMEFRNYSWFPFAHGCPAPEDLEIIGNIYENSELLGGTNERVAV